LRIFGFFNWCACGEFSLIFGVVEVINIKEIQMQKTKKSKDPKRYSVTIYEAQLKEIDRICREQNKTRRTAFLEAFQNYISANSKRGNDE